MHSHGTLLPAASGNLADPAAFSEREQDLGPLAWVQAPLAQSVDVAIKQLRRYLLDAQEAQDSELVALDTVHLHHARAPLHQAAGALEMVNMPAAAALLCGMEAAVQRFQKQPAACNEAAVKVLEQSGFALMEYVDAMLAGHALPAVALFPQYRDLQSLLGNDKVHPADLWRVELPDSAWQPSAPTAAQPALPYGAAARTQLEQAVLGFVKTADPAAAAQLREVCLGLARTPQPAQAAQFWSVAAGLFDALAHQMLVPDVYLKRVASRVLMQYTLYAKGSTEGPGRLLQDMLFFCAQAGGQASAPAVWQAVYAGMGLQQHRPVDYAQPMFGRIDPGVLVQARKRVAVLAELWSSLVGGDRTKLKATIDQVGMVCDSLLQLHPHSRVLSQTLREVVQGLTQRTEPPEPGLAMEVATAVLYLQATFAHVHQDQRRMAAHSQVLAERLRHVQAGQPPLPLEAWMEELYRQTSDAQTMGSVVGELRSTLAEAEKALEQFFRQSSDSALLSPVVGYLTQMRGVLSVLGLEQAALAMLRMREVVEALLQGQVTGQDQARQFERLGNSLGALGFLIDMLSYQRAMARKLFVYDEALGELRPIMGRSVPAVAEVAAEAVVPPQAAPGDALAAEVRQAELLAPEPTAQTPASAPAVVPGPPPTLAGLELPVLTELAPDLDFFPPEVVAEKPAAFAPAATELEHEKKEGAEQGPHSLHPVSEDMAATDGESGDGSDAELLDIFLGEAQEVIAAARAALLQLAAQPEQLEEQVHLRRAFHTLKGSARMVGLGELGEGAWAFEQLLNDWLQKQQAMPEAMQQLAQQALTAMEAWTQAIARHAAQQWSAAPLRAAADAMRERGEWMAVDADMLCAPSVPAVLSEPSEPSEPATPSAVELPALMESAEEVDYAEFAAALQSPSPVAGSGLPFSVETPQALTTHSAPSAGDSASTTDDAATRQIGDLRIPAQLFEVFLGEAEDASLQLQQLLQSWTGEPAAEVLTEASGLAHNLAGSSAAVGFYDLSALARALEAALLHLALDEGMQEPGVPRALQAGAEEVRRLLHQFAAGFLRAPQPQVLQALQAMVQVPAEHAPALEEDASAAHGATPEQCDALVPEHVPEPWSEPLPEALHPSSAQPSPNTAPEPAAASVAPAPSPALVGIPVLAAEDDDLDVYDVVDPDLFPIFEDEATELLPALVAAMRQWCAQPELLDARQTVMRALHTLKGSARLAGAMRLGERAHRLESQIEALDAQQLAAADIEPLLLQVDGLQANFEALRAGGGVDAAASVALPVMVSPGVAAMPRQAPPPASARSMPSLLSGLVPAPRSASQQTVRVRSQLLDKLINEAGEVMIARSRLDARMGMLKSTLADLGGNLERLRQQLRDLEVQAESQMQSRMAYSKEAGSDFDPLEFDRFTRVQELTRMMAESVNDVATVQRNLQREVVGAEDDLVAQGRQARELQRNLLRTRMVEFDSVAERLYAVVRGTAKETGKQVTLDIEGGTIEMDRGVLERMTPAFEHLLRNCVDHGIELPAQRSAAGKPAQGVISVQVQQEGNDVAVAIRDDGAGLHVQRIRDKALKLGLVHEDDVVDGARAAELIFMPGFTTVTAVTGLSGRGIGMDVVRNEVQSLGGRIETETQQGQGSMFRMVLPLTTAVTQVAMLRMGSFTVAIPANLVETVKRLNQEELDEAYRSGVLREGAVQLPLYWGGAVWQQSARSNEEDAGRTRPVLILRSAAQRIALHVDELLGNQEVVVKHLGPQMAHLPGLTGMSVLPSGAVVLIYNPVALTAVYAERIRSRMQVDGAAHDGIAGLPGGGEERAAQVPLVMVVDDSITVRRVTQRLLQREGYRVVLAADGLQALEKLEAEQPCVVLSDIEMPRMDGFDLVRQIRADGRWPQLPLIMITSRTADKHREHALALGANHYLGKPYRDEELMHLVHHYAALVRPPEAALAG